MTTATPTPPTDAAQSTSGAQSNQPPAAAPAAADALYGNQQKATSDQTQPAATPNRPAESKPDAETANASSEAYELTAPEGRTIDPEVLGSFSEVARELNLSKDAAQTVLDRLVPKMAERQAAQLDSFRSQWTEASKTDKEFGGDRLPENLTVARKALESFGSPELRSLLNESGLGNHPEIIRFMVRAGRAISEDRFVGNSEGAAPGRGAPKDFNAAASALYPQP
jgi:hypothetical protein